MAHDATMYNVVCYIERATLNDCISLTAALGLRLQALNKTVDSASLQEAADFVTDAYKDLCGVQQELDSKKVCDCGKCDECVEAMAAEHPIWTGVK